MGPCAGDNVSTQRCWPRTAWPLQSDRDLAARPSPLSDSAFRAFRLLATITDQEFENSARYKVRELFMDRELADAQLHGSDVLETY